MSGSTQAGDDVLLYLTEPEINYLRRLVQNAICTGAHSHDLLVFEGSPPRPRAEIRRIMALEEKLKSAWLRAEVPRTARPYTVPGDLEIALRGAKTDGEE